jgi:hypothetical protein
MTHRTIHAGGPALAVLGLIAVAAYAGGSAPAVAPVAHEGATPIPSLPFAIRTSGHYVVTRGLQGVAGQNGITIAAGVEDVTLDLGGFELEGVPGSLDGIRCVALGVDLVVRGGSVDGWGDDGVDLEAARNVRVSEVHAGQNGGRGIVAGDEALVERCLARANGGDGIHVGRCALVLDSIAASNDGHGIVAGNAPSVNSASVVRSSSACFNTGYGIRIAPGGVVSDCAVIQNSGGAIEASNALVRGNSAGGAINASASTVLENHEF